MFLLFLFGLGSAGETLALGKARRAIEALKEVAPDTARRLRADGGEETIPAEEVRAGDRLVVLPFERIPADGTVLEGRSAVDQAAITGESMPVDKEPGEPVFAGTINGEARLLLEASRAATDSTLSRLIVMVEQAQTEKSPAQQLTDRIEKWYVPSVFLVTILVIVLPPLTMGGEGAWSTWFYRAMAFLTAASPCAIAIGGPATVLCGVARAARMGVLVKGGGPLETLGRVRAMCFDKTGTLTVGRPRVVEVVPVNGVAEDEALRLAAAVEAETTHPLARAVVRAAAARGNGAAGRRGCASDHRHRRGRPGGGGDDHGGPPAGGGPPDAAAGGARADRRAGGRGGDGGVREPRRVADRRDRAGR